MEPFPLEPREANKPVINTRYVIAQQDGLVIEMFHETLLDIPDWRQGDKT